MNKPRVDAMKQARKLFEAGDLVGAETWCRRALTLLPILNGRPWYFDELPLLGDILLAQGRPEDALECYLNEIAEQRRSGNLDPADPDHPTPNVKVALAYCRLGNFKMAKKYSLPLPEDYPGSGDIRVLEASLLFIRGGQEGSFSRQALSYFEAAEKLAPENWMIVDRIGYVLYDLNRYEEAIATYRRAMKLGGDKVPYEHRIKVEMYDWYKKQNKEKENKPQEKAPK